MTPKEALQHKKKKGGRLYEPITPRDLYLLDVDAYFRQRGTVVVATTVPATNPGHEHGTSSAEHAEALAASRAGRIIRKVLK